MIDVAAAEALVDMGLDLDEVAAELGCDVAAVQLALAPPSPPARKVEQLVRPGLGGDSARMGSRVPSSKPQSEEMTHLVKVAHAAPDLIAWTGHDDNIAARCEDIQGPGRMAPFRVGGRLVSRAGMVRLVAEKMCERKYGERLALVPEARQNALVGLSVLAMECLFEALKAAEPA